MIRLLIVLLFYVIGPALIFWGAIKRYRSGVKPDFMEVVAVCFAVVVITVSIYFLSSNVSTEQDLAEADRLVSALLVQYNNFPVRDSVEDKPAVYAEVDEGRPVVSIYGVTDAVEQHKIVTIIESLSTEMGIKPVLVKFFQKQVWEQGGDGQFVQARHKETLLHRYLLE